MVNFKFRIQFGNWVLESVGSHEGVCVFESVNEMLCVVYIGVLTVSRELSFVRD